MQQTLSTSTILPIWTYPCYTNGFTSKDLNVSPLQGSDPQRNMHKNHLGVGGLNLKFRSLTLHDSGVNML